MFIKISINQSIDRSINRHDQTMIILISPKKVV